MTSIALGGELCQAGRGRRIIALLCTVLMAAGAAGAVRTPQPAAGTYHSLVVKSDGSLWACGLNEFGQLGDGTTSDRHLPVRVGTNADWVAVAAAGEHSAALKADGTLWGWGFNDYGEIGDGSYTERDAPVRLAGQDWKAVACGVQHGVALKADGTLWAWGDNTYGQLGDNTTTPHAAPTRIGGASDWVAIAAGQYHTVARKSNGTLWAWGDNANGKLGDGTTTQRHAPVQVGTNVGWVAVAAGDAHTMGLKADGTLWGWGNNSAGQLGDGTGAEHHLPVQVGPEVTWAFVACGSTHTLAGKADGTLWAFGDNQECQLGDDSGENQNAPVQVGTDTKWLAVAGGLYHSMGVAADGNLWGWGLNFNGQLGDGTSYLRGTPWWVGMDNKLIAMTGGAAHSAAVKSDGTLWTWGFNASGQLGDWTTTSRTNAAQIGTSTTWREAAAGTSHTVARKADGTLWAWGRNADGQLGDGTAVGKPAPVQVGVAQTWSAVDAGADHNVARMADGTLWAWGSNTYGQVGDGSTASRHSPMHLGTATNWIAAVAGGEHTVALKADGTLWAWGRNAHGQLGNGTTNDTSTPTRIGTATNWVAVTAGVAHTLARRSDGTLWAWGYNGDGELGDETTDDKTVPVQVWVGIANHWVEVAAGDYHTVARRSDGTLWAWGRNTYGQLGDGSTNNRVFPGQIGVGSNWVLVTAGAAHTLARTSDGTLWAWGYNSSGQLGLGDIADRHSPATYPASPITTYSVTASSGGNGSISPTRQQMVNIDSTLSFTLTPDSGYHIGSVTGYGGTLSNNTFTTVPITSNFTVTATFGLDPSVVTGPITNITATTAAGGGNVTSEGDASVSARGVCWNTTGSPTTNDNHTTDGSGAGVFASAITGLTSGQPCFVRAYAVNAQATVYGAQRVCAATMTPPGSALQFDGVDDYVQVADAASLDLTNNYTLECWFKADSFGGLRGLIGKYQTGGANGYLLRLTGTGLDFDQMTNTAVALQAGRWYHVAAVNSNSTRLLYLNGVAQALGGAALTVRANSDPLRLASDYGGRYFAGQMDEVRIWNGVRSAADIRDAMHRQLAGSESGLIAYHQFNLLSGTVSADLTTNNNTGTLQNGPAWVAGSVPCANTLVGRNNLRGAWLAKTNSLASSILSISNAVMAGTNFRVFGHDGAALTNDTPDKPVGYNWRLNRVWQTEGTGALTGTLTFDCTGITNLLVQDGAFLRLLTDADGIFANAGTVTGSYAGGVFSVTGQSFPTNGYYTIAQRYTADWVIAATAGVNGTIAPSGNVRVVPGGTVNFVITPATYWHVGDVTTNSASVGAVTAFTWSNVVADGTINATFAANLAAQGTPHWWLAQYGLTNGGWTFNQAETNRSDSDPLDNGQEYVADTDPTNPASYFRVAAVSNVSSWRLYFLSSSNRQYTMHWCSNLVNGVWTNIPGAGPRPGTGGADTLSDTNMPPNGPFYRLKVELP